MANVQKRNVLGERKRGKGAARSNAKLGAEKLGQLLCRDRCCSREHDALSVIFPFPLLQLLKHFSLICVKVDGGRVPLNPMVDYKSDATENQAQKQKQRKNAPQKDAVLHLPHLRILHRCHHSHSPCISLHHAKRNPRDGNKVRTKAAESPIASLSHVGYTTGHL